jgi:gas vesicle protein
MAYGEDRRDHGGGGFIVGFLAGTMVGAGLGLLFAPKPGADFRNQISEQADSLANTASEGYRRMSDTAGDLAVKGRQAYGKVRSAVSRGADGAKRFAQEATSGETVGPYDSSDERLG